MSSPFRALVDPDNRRPVDFGWHQAMLRRLMGGSPPDAETRKLFIILRLLGLRAPPARAVRAARAPTGRSTPATSVCAFLRGGELLVAVATRPGALSGERSRRRPAAGATCCAARSTISAGATPVARLLSRRGIAVFERL